MSNSEGSQPEMLPHNSEAIHGWQIMLFADGIDPKGNHGGWQIYKHQDGTTGTVFADGSCDNESLEKALLCCKKMPRKAQKGAKSLADSLTGLIRRFMHILSGLDGLSDRQN